MQHVDVQIEQANRLPARRGRRRRTARSCRGSPCRLADRVRRGRSTGPVEPGRRAPSCRASGSSRSCPSPSCCRWARRNRCRSIRSAGRSRAFADRPGRISVGSWPSLASSSGKAPQTSARPPVLAKGTASLVASRIFTRAFSLTARSDGPFRRNRCVPYKRYASSVPPDCISVAARPAARLPSGYQNRAENDNAKGVARAIQWRHLKRRPQIGEIPRKKCEIILPDPGHRSCRRTDGITTALNLRQVRAHQADFDSIFPQHGGCLAVDG